MRLAISVLGIALLVVDALSSEAATRRPGSTAPKFDFVYETGWGTKLDTYDSTLTKDLVGLPDTTIHVVLSHADRDSVLLEMQEINFFALPEPQPPYPGCGPLEPSTSVRIEATLGGQTHRLVWDSGSVVCAYDDSGVWGQILELQRLIVRVMKRQPGYQTLPRPRGAYY